MPYVPRPATTIKCAHCKTPFESHHASRKYCSNSCNVLASYERTGYRGEPRASRADLERTLAKMMELMKVKSELATDKPAAPKPAAKAEVKQAPKAAEPVAPDTKPAKKVAPPAAKAVTTPKSTKKATKQRAKAEKPAVRVMSL